MNFRFLGAILIQAAVVAGCGEPTMQSAEQGAADVAGYREWPLRRAVVNSTAGHGATATVYANHIVSNYLAKAAPDGVTTETSVLRYPQGSIIVKDVLNAGGTLEYVAIMRKVDVPPEGVDHNDGWVFAKRSSSTAKDQYQPKSACFDCHANANTPHFRDGVYVFPNCAAGIVCDD